MWLAQRIAAISHITRLFIVRRSIESYYYISRLSHLSPCNSTIQLTGVGAGTDIGQHVLLNVEEELKPEPGLVPTLLQLMVVQSVLETVPKLRPVTKLLVQVWFKKLLRAQLGGYHTY